MKDEVDEHAIGYQVLPRGTHVEASDGTRVGTFEKALYHRREHLLDGIVVKTIAGRRFVDAPEIARITNLRVILTIGPGEVAGLPAHRGAMAQIGERTTRRAKRLRRR